MTGYFKRKNTQKPLGDFRLHKYAILTCALLAGEGEVVVAGYVIPLTVLMPDHYHTVFTRREETVRLVWSPVFILLQGKNMDIAEYYEYSNLLVKHRFCHTWLQ